VLGPEKEVVERPAQEERLDVLHDSLLQLLELGDTYPSRDG
jgi:hypothetical protein